MRKLITLLLLSVSISVQAQTYPDLIRTTPVPATGANKNNRATVDANLKAAGALNIPRFAVNTLNGAKDSIGYIGFNTTLQKFVVYKGGGVWDTYATMADLAGSGVTSFNGRTGVVNLTSTDINTALGFTPENVANKTNTISNSTTLYPSAKGVQDYTYGKSYVDSVASARVVVVNAPADTTTDSYDLMQNAINFMAGKGTLRFNGNFYLNKSFAGALVLPANAAGLIIDFQYGSVRLSRNVPRLFDEPYLGNPNAVAIYQNIIIRNLRLNANNIDGTAMAAPVTVTANATGINGSFIDVVVGDNTGFLNTTSLCFFPFSNTGTTKGIRRLVRRKAGSTTTLQVVLQAGETIVSGDIIKGAITDHVILGTYANGTFYANVNHNNITLENINVINVPPGEVTPIVNGSVTSGSTNRSIIYITSQTATAAGLGGYSGQLYAKNITARNVKAYGGQSGFAIAGVTNSPNFWVENIFFKDNYHTTLTVPTNQYSSQNFLIGNKGFGNNVLFDNCIGELSGDVGIELDVSTARINNCTIRNCYGAAFFSTNYSAPALTSAGPPTTTLSGSITTGSSSITLASFPAAVANEGWLTIDNELFYYAYTGTATLTVTRGLNQTASVAHSSGATVTFIEIDKQLIRYTNCRNENTLLASSLNGFQGGWQQRRNSIYPLPPLYINNCSYYRSGTDIGFLGEAMHIEGQSNVNVNGFTVNVTGINRTTTSAASADALYFFNQDYDTGSGASSRIPPAPLRLKNITISVDGTLDNSSAGQYFGIHPRQGNWLLDFEGILIKENLQSTGFNQAGGIWIDKPSSFISGTINNYKFAANGGVSPIGVLMQNSTYGRLYFNNLDFSELKFTTTATNSNYKPWFLDLTTATSNNVFFGPNIRHAITATVPGANTTLKRVKVTAATYTQNLTEDYIGVNAAAPTTITLSLVEAGSSTSKTNYGKQVYIGDDLFNAATNNITITPASGEKINNSTSSITINTNGGGYYLTSIPGGWTATANAIQLLNISTLTGITTAAAINVSGNVTAAAATTASQVVIKSQSDAIVSDSIGYVQVQIATTSKIKYFRPTANTDAARGIALVAAHTFSQVGDAITVAPGNYLISSAIALKTKQTINFNGAKVYHTNKNINLYNVQNASDVSMLGNGELQGSGITTGLDTTSEAGVKITGASTNFSIKGLKLTNFNGSAIFNDQRWADTTQYFSGGRVTDCIIENNNYGVYSIGQYWKIAGNTIRFNKSALYIFSGNAILDRNSITFNVRGISIVGGSGNEGHGAVTGNLINHNSGVGIFVSDIRIGMAFTGNIIAGGYPVTTVDTTIYINASKGIIFNGGEFLAPIRIVLAGAVTGYNYVKNVFFYTNFAVGSPYPTVSGTALQKSHLRFEQNTSNDSISNALNVGISPFHGGTGKTQISPYRLLAGGVTNADSLQQVGIGTTGQVLTSNGASALPTFQTPSAAVTPTLQQVTTAGATTTVPLIVGNITGSILKASGSAGGFYLEDRTTASHQWTTASVGDVLNFAASGLGNVYTVDYNTQVLTFTQSPIVPTATASGQAVNFGQLSGFELLSNKSNSTSLGTSTTLFPTQNAVKVYADTKQPQLNGTGFIKASGTTISYDNSTYLTTSTAASTYESLSNKQTDLTASSTKYPTVNAVNLGLTTVPTLQTVTASGATTTVPIVINPTINSTFALNVSNLGTTGANGAYVNIGPSSTGVIFRADKNGVEKFSVNNDGSVKVATAPVSANDVVRKTELDLKAPLASPTFTGSVVVPTPTTGTQAANKDYVDNAIPPQHVYVINNYSSVGSATTTFTVTIGTSVPDASYRVSITPANSLTAGTNYYITNRNTSTFDIVFTSAMTGTVSFDWVLFR